MGTARTDAELWAAMESLDDDLLDPDLPAAILDEQLRKAGTDPAALAAEGAAFVERLKEEKRLAWQDKARRKKERFASRCPRPVPSTLSREDTLVRLDNYRRHPIVGPQLAVNFRKRKPQESSDEELRELLEDIEALLATDDDGTHE